MSRYIDADALKTIKSIQSADFNSVETIQKWIDSAPTIDAVSVVRCGECKHMYDGIKGDGYLICHKFNHFIKADDFCSYGEPNER